MRPARRVSRVRRRWPLRYRFVNDDTNDTYFRWVSFYLQWCVAEERDARDPLVLDSNVTDFIELMHQDDHALSSAGYVLSGLQHFCCIPPHR